jgi:hypothetical protein
MSSPYHRILCPIDFDDNSLAALRAAADLVQRFDGTIFVLHVGPMFAQPIAMPTYVDMYKSQKERHWPGSRTMPPTICPGSNTNC